jgi:hypothetical protein
MNIFESNLNPLSVVFKARNQAVDSIFYDVSALTFDEWLRLSPVADKKGKIIVVSPSGKATPIRHYESSEAFLLSDDWRNVFAIAIAGVGSSVIGTAALARSVADACQADVAGVVSGYGLSDVIVEGLGGWFFYGKIDQFRYEMQAALEDVSAIVSSSFTKGGDVKKYLRRYFDTPLDAYVPSSPDVGALHDILMNRYVQDDGEKKLQLLVGHSKGNLLISSVLNHISYSLRDTQKATDPFHNLAVVSLGAVVDIPCDIIMEANQYQFLGSLDLLGRLNSRSIAGDIARRTSIPGVWHSLNTRLPGHMDAKKLLEEKVLPNLKKPSVALEGRAGSSGRRNRVAAAYAAMASKN